MATLYNNKHKWGVHGRSYMFTNHKASRQYKSRIAGKFRYNRKRQAHEYWKDTGKWYMRNEHVFE